MQTKQQEKDSKYLDHVRVNGWTNVDMKNIGQKRVNWDNVWYGIIIGLLFIMAVLSWVTVRDDHPFNKIEFVQQPATKTVQL